MMINCVQKAAQDIRNSVAFLNAIIASDITKTIAMCAPCLCDIHTFARAQPVRALRRYQ